MSIHSEPATAEFVEETGAIEGDGDIVTIPETAPQLRRRVLDLAWPVIGENMLETMLDIVNTVLVASLGAVALAGVGSGLQIMFFVLAALAALSVGSSVLVAQAVGARDMARASRFARQSLLWSVILSVPLAIVGGLTSTWHYLVEWNPTWEGDSCGMFGPACSDLWFRTFGFSTLAFMALCGFVSIVVFNLVSFPPTTEQEHS